MVPDILVFHFRGCYCKGARGQSSTMFVLGDGLQMLQGKWPNTCSRGLSWADKSAWNAFGFLSGMLYIFIILG